MPFQNKPFMRETTLVILGPTCSWKSSVAISLCQKLGGEVISCDSMQIYQGLAIGTAQPTLEERKQIPHHLIDELPLETLWNADKFVPAANRLRREIISRGRTPVVAGGTGMYAKALCYEMSLLPGDPGLAAELRKVLETPKGVAALREELRQAAGNRPIPADLWANPRRVARAIEVLRITSRLPWELHPSPLPARPSFCQFCILPDFDMLKRRIRRRCEAMLKAGWEDECMTAVSHGLLQSPTAWQALGYRDIANFRKEIPTGHDDELAELLANRTISYARRQLTWFKHQHPGAHILPIDHEENAKDSLTEEILKLCMNA